MKVLVFIFGLFILFLSVVPCYCEELGTDPCRTEQSIHQHDDQQHNDQGDAACTPFCHCSNFHHPNFFVDDHFSDELVFSEIPQYSLYSENAPLSVIYDFWQPPKL